MPDVAHFVRKLRPGTWAGWPFGFGVATAIVALAPVAAEAEPLPPETCEALIEERALLEGGGAGENIARGVEWGKSKLTPEQLDYIKRLIAVREAVTFRCRSYNVVREPSPPGAIAGDNDAAKESATVPPPVRKRATETAGPATAKATPPPADASKTAVRKPAKPAKPETLPRPAKNDAYVPPEGTESTLKVPAAIAPEPQPQ